MNEYFGISDDRSKHMLSVARQCYKLAKESNLDECKCRELFVIGYLHDIGYEFCDKDSIVEHPDIGFSLLESTLGINLKCIRLHGNPDVIVNPSKYGLTDNELLQLKFLDIADLTVNATGEIVSVEDRLNDIKTRHGEDSVMYTNPKLLASLLDLI